MWLVESELTYQCPGERGTISPSVHRARMASGFQKCHNCPHSDHSLTASPLHVKPSQNDGLTLNEHRLRGIYLRPLTPSIVMDILAGPLTSLWSQTMRTVQTDTRVTRQSLYRPSIAVSCDLRLASLEIYRAVLSSLELTGCHVVEFGPLAEAQFCFGIQHHNLSAGVYITGNGDGPAYSGFDLFREHGLPWKLQTQDSPPVPASRLTRTSGTTRQERITLPYETHLKKYFHGLRPLSVFLSVCDEPMKATLEQLFSRLPCTATIDVVVGELNARLTETADRVSESKCDLGFVIGEDAGECFLIDERGQTVSNQSLLQLISHSIRREQPSCTILAAPEFLDSDPEFKIGVEQTHQDLELSTREIYEQRSGVGLLEENRFWFFDQHPRCDALVTLAWALKSLSLSDASVSEVIGS